MINIEITTSNMELEMFWATVSGTRTELSELQKWLDENPDDDRSGGSNIHQDGYWISGHLPNDENCYINVAFFSKSALMEFMLIHR